jgi:hypothetical protein
VLVDPFRACLIKVSAGVSDELTIEGCAYEVIREVDGRPIEVDLLGMPGQRANVRLAQTGPDRDLRRVRLDGRSFSSLIGGSTVRATFPGRQLQRFPLQHLADLQRSVVPDDAEAIYESCCFAGDNNALEIRSLLRAGPSRHAPVEAARAALLESEPFLAQGIWDRFLFDGDARTAFRPHRHTYTHGRQPVGLLRVDLGVPVEAGAIRLLGVPADYTCESVQASADLRSWIELDCGIDVPGSLAIGLPDATPIRYMRLQPAPLSAAGVAAYPREDPASDADDHLRPHLVRGGGGGGGGGRASNLFASYDERPARFAWSATIEIDEVLPTSYLAVCVPGDYGTDGAWAALRVDGHIIGAPDRAPSYIDNPWEHYGSGDGNYTYYFPLDETMLNREIEVVVLGMVDGMRSVRPSVWLCPGSWPWVEMRLTLE